MEELEQLLSDAIDQQGWNLGGVSYVHAYAGHLVVVQSQAGQEQVQRVIDELRASLK
jgi:hypothetical protein